MRAAGRRGVRRRDRDQDSNSDIRRRSAVQRGRGRRGTAAAVPSPVTSGPIGTAFTITTQDDNGNNVSYNVTAETVDQHAGLGPYETLNNNADHMAAVKFTITGVTGQVSDDANGDAVAIGSDTTEYQPSFNTVTDGGNFNSGTFAVAPGETSAAGCRPRCRPGRRSRLSSGHREARLAAISDLECSKPIYLAAGSARRRGLCYSTDCPSR